MLICFIQTPSIHLHNISSLVLECPFIGLHNAQFGVIGQRMLQISIFVDCIFVFPLSIIVNLTLFQTISSPNFPCYTLQDTFVQLRFLVILLGNTLSRNSLSSNFFLPSLFLIIDLSGPMPPLNQNASFLALKSSEESRR